MSFSTRPHQDYHIPEDSQEGLKKIADGTAHLQDS